MFLPLALLKQILARTIVTQGEKSRYKPNQVLTFIERGLHVRDASHRYGIVVLGLGAPPGLPVRVQPGLLPPAAVEAGQVCHPG
eukprot:scaffold444672_cov50-Prasinocladus_malaysianus.AAC.1